MAPEQIRDIIAAKTSARVLNFAKLINTFLLEKTITKEMSHFNDDSGSILYWVSMNWVVAYRMQIENDLNDLIKALIVAGSDLNVSLQEGHIEINYSILLLMVLCFLDKPRRELSNVVKIWLQLLSDAGVDLVEHGRMENILHRDGKSSWTCIRNIENVESFENWCTFELLEMRIGKSPEDSYLEFEDLYVSEGLAVPFWLLVEGDEG